MTLHELADRVGAKRVGQEYRVRCPVHDDNRPSLEFRGGDKGIVMTCRSRGCAVKDIVSAWGLTMADIMADNGRPRTRTPYVKTYLYHDEHGTIVYRKRRTADKEFHFSKADGKGGWIDSKEQNGGRPIMEDVPRHVYRRHELVGERIIAIAEGEKDADRLWSLGIPATTNDSGAKTWTDLHTAQLAGVEEVWIFEDHDDDGRTRSAIVGRSCAAAGIRARIVRLPELAPKQDVSDWLDAGHTFEELLSLTYGAPLWTDAAPPTAAAAPSTFARLPGGGYTYTLPQGVSVEVRYLRRQAGAVHGEIDVRCEWPGARHHQGSLSCADHNLSSQAARKALAKYCAERARTKAEDFDWSGVIDAACLLTLRAEREGEAPIVLDDAPDLVEADVTVHGLTIPFDATSMLIAHGDSLKSLIVLLVLGTLAQRGVPVLYCDFEWTGERHKKRKRRLFGHDRIANLYHMRCHNPLVIEADRIRRFCEAHQIRYLAIDSVGLACDGKLIDDDVAIRFHRALGSLPPALCAAHVPKSALGPDSKGDALGPFGSVFFSNLCRMSWLVKKQPGATADLVTVGLFPQKQNDGARYSPAALEFTFSTPQIEVRSVDVADVDGLSQRLPIRDRILKLIRRRSMTMAELEEALEAKLDSIQKAIRRCPKDFVVMGEGKDAMVARKAQETQ